MGFLDSVTSMLANSQKGAPGGGGAGAPKVMGGRGGKAGVAAALFGQYMQSQQGGKTGQATPAAAADTSSVDPAASARCCNRVALLNVAGWRDGAFSPAERMVLVHYVLHSDDLTSDAKVELLKEVEKPPAEVQDFWQKAKENLSHERLFASDEQAQAFSQALEQLVKADGELSESEIAFVRMIKQACGLQ
jgi:uncharacterized tellurite resistance protein B-like protein